MLKQGTLALLIYFLSCTAYAEIFKIDIYKDPKCTSKLAGPPIVMDTAKACNSYSYVDSKGVTTTGSQNNLRCYTNKIIFDKYPFSGNCLASESYYQGKQILQKNHSLHVAACKKAPSHDGFVYEKLSGYTYPGNVNCKK